MPQLSNFPTPPKGLLGIGSASSGMAGRDGSIPEKNIVEFFAAGVKLYLRQRRGAEREWREARRAYHTEPDDDLDAFELWRNRYGEHMHIGVFKSFVDTTVAALVANSPAFFATPTVEQAREKAKMIQVLLNHEKVWDAKRRQYDMERLVKCGHQTGLMIGLCEFESDYDAFEKRMKREERELRRRDRLTTQELALEDLISPLEEIELEDIRDEAPKEFTGNFDHSRRMDEVGMTVIDPFDYVADPNARDLAYGPRWEGRRIRKYVKDWRVDKRYRGDARINVKPTHQIRKGLEFPVGAPTSHTTDRRFAAALPEEYQIAEAFEVYWYDDPDHRDTCGSLITVIPDQGLVLERRPNPWGFRPYVVEDWNGDGSSLFPDNDYKGVRDLIRAFTEVLYRGIRQIRKAPNGTLIVPTSSNINRDQLEGVLQNDDGGVAAADIDDEKDIRQQIMELKTRQVSPETLNFTDKILQYLQVFWGMGPNQLAGGALKSETSGTEAGEVARFARVRLDFKGNPLDRFIVRMAENVVGAVLRFKTHQEIVSMIGAELAEAGVDISKAKAARISEVGVHIVPGSMRQDADVQAMGKVMAILQAVALDPTLSEKADRDAIAHLINKHARLQTGRDIFVDLDSDTGVFNAFNSLINSGRNGGSPPRPPAQQGNGIEGGF